MRARNIKPGFYKNADLAECSIWARFLAPGLWMLADKEGRLLDRPKQIKGEIFPYDDVDISALLDELAKYGHLIRYEISGQRFIQICKFKEHQRPHTNELPSIIPEYQQVKSASLNKESTSNLGDKHFALNDDTLTTDSHFLNPEEGVVGISASPALIADPPPLPRVDFQKLVSIWNDELGNACPKIQRLTEQRKRLFANRLRDSFDSDLERWRAYCQAIRGSPFCMGQNDRGWRANIDWALQPQAVAKVLEGFYNQAEITLQRAPTRTDLAIEEARKLYAKSG